MVRRVLSAFVVVLGTSAAVQAAARDAIDLSKVTVYNSPADVASWPVTTAITNLHMRPSGDPAAGVSLTFSAQQTWPDYTPPGWAGPLQYTVWPVVKVNGLYYTSGIIQMWRGRVSTGAPLPSQWYNWAYDSRWGPMNYYAGYQPQAGELVGFFVTAGNARGVATVTSVRERSNVVTISLPGSENGDWTFPSTFQTTAGDADGDGRADIALFRPSTGLWQGLGSSTNYTSGVSATWGMSGDIPVAADYDGDGRLDVAVYRPSGGYWYTRWSSANYANGGLYQWGGQAGDVPLAADFDGDGKADLVIYRPSNGLWYTRWSSTNYASGDLHQWGGQAGDVPMAADFDGDGKADFAIYRPSTGVWYTLLSTVNYAYGPSGQWGGQPGDIPITADFDGDGKTDLTIYRPSSGLWYIRLSSAKYASGPTIQWGMLGDIPVAADYDGDGKADLSVFRPSTGEWWLRGIGLFNLGISGDIPALARP